MAGKNSQIHVMVETKFMNELKNKAKEKGLTLSEYCRQKLKEDSQLERIEKKLEKIGNR